MAQAIRRVRSGRIEIYCERSGVWWWSLAYHVHRHHRSMCRCKNVCLPLITAGKVERGRKRQRR